jgi:serine/threonine-protein kinase RsbW
MSTAAESKTVKGEPQVKVEIRSNPLYLSGVREMISAVAKRLGFAEDACGQMALAVDEALCNVIRHGYAKQPDRPIWLTLYPEGGAWESGSPSPLNGATDERADALRIIIEDEAQQVDPSKIQSRDLEQIRPGGLGVHIIKTVMDEAYYEKRGPVGMRLTMVKKRQTESKATPGASGGCCGGQPGCAGKASGEVRHG